MTDCDKCSGCGKADEAPIPASAVLLDWKKAFVSREEFLKLLSFALTGVIGLVVTVPPLALAFQYFFAPKNKEWVTLGPIDKFEEGKTVDVVFRDPSTYPWDGVTAQRSAWLRRVQGEQFTAFAINCTHLGCPIRWEAGPELFMCPCHGGVFYSDGQVAGGPPPRPLHQYPVRIENGQVLLSVVPVLNQG